MNPAPQKKDHGAGLSTAFEVCLVNMPYADIVCPSIALGLLQARLHSDSIGCKTFYPNLHFADRIGMKFYGMIGWRMHQDFMFADWSFGRGVFPDNPEKDARYARRMAELIASSSIIPFETTRTTTDIEGVVAAIYELRDHADAFVEECAVRILSRDPKIVGCTSSLEQHLPSIALLKRIRELSPDTVTVIGGANCEGIMGEAAHRNFPWIDYSVSGEADTIITPLFRSILEHGRNVPAESLPDVVLSPRQRSYSGRSAPWGVCKNLDELPFPDYRDYFEEIEKSGFNGYIKPSVVLESSRGCWWAARRKCTFCGLNNPEAGYRSKSPERFLEEVDRLGEAYDTPRFIMVDNIMDMGYFKTVLPSLQSPASDRRFFFETKGNLNREQVRAFKEAGVHWIQPGIESLHPDTLKLMNKGISVGQIIQLMKWAREYGVRMIWLFLWGFPGEKDSWYEEISRWVPLIEHLEPPKYNLFRIHIQRHSHYFDNPRQYDMDLGIMNAMPYVYQLGKDDLHDLSYRFLPRGWKDNFVDPDLDEMEGRDGMKKLESVISKWQERFEGETTPVLAVRDNGVHIDVEDTRRIAEAPCVQLSGDLRRVYLLCDKNIKKQLLVQTYEETFNRKCAESKMGELIAELEAQKLVLEVDDRFIALGVHGDNPKPVSFSEFPGATLDVERLQADGLFEKMGFIKD